MKPVKLTPKKTSEGWLLNIPPTLSETGKRQRRFFPSRDEAERHAGPLRQKYREGAAGKVLPPDQGRFAARAFELLGNRPPEEIVTAVNLWLEKHNHAAKSVTFGTACEEFRNAESKKHLTEKYRDNFRLYPIRFPALAGKLLVDISTADLEKELSVMPAVAKNRAAANLSALWGFSIKRGWATLNPLENVERAHSPAPTVPTLTGEQLGRLFQETIIQQPELVPMLAVEVFAGVRPAEAEKLAWEDFDFSDRVLSIPGAVAKTRRGRHIEMHPTLVAWLNWHTAQGRGNSGRICPYLATTLRRRLRAIRKAAGIPAWPQDCLRHTFASAALASDWRDIGKLCIELGHSSQAMLFKHYHRAMKKPSAEAVFAVLPPKGKTNIVRFAAA